MPIFKSPEPSSCVQCHLASVDLKDYIRPSSQETFLSLRDGGLIDIEAPERSKILTLIDMGESDPDRGAALIHAKTRKLELEAFRDWILACCHDPRFMQLSSESPADPPAPRVNDEVIRYSRKDRVLDSFVRNIWSQRMRCFPCHTPHEINADNPAHAEPAKRHAEYVSQYGQRMNLFTESPATTLRAWITSSGKRHGDSLPLINLASPADSLILLKPTSKVPGKNPDGTLQPPSSALPVSHGGGLKMYINDTSYKACIAWIRDYANIASGGYKHSSQLPSDNWFPTNQFIRIQQAPEAWPVMSVVQMFFYEFDDSEVMSSPVAFTQAIVTPKRMLNGNIILLGTDVGDPSEPPVKLHSGRYQIRVVIDTQGKLDSLPEMLLDDGDAIGEATIDANWGEGFPNAETVVGTIFKSLQ